MIYASILASMGLLMAYAGMHEDFKVLFALGLLLFMAGQLAGHYIEEMMDKRIKELENKLKDKPKEMKGIMMD